MSNSKKLIKMAGMINCILGVIAIKIPVYGVISLLIGIVFYLFSISKDNRIMRNRYLLLIIGIISILFNFISSILIICAYDEIENYVKSHGKNAPPKVIYKKDKETAKLDLLIKLGVGMIFISGILFATTTWDYINLIIKVLLLVLFGILFIILSLFTDKKLNLYKSSYMYWILGISFFILTIVGMLYFGISGTYLTYKGTGKYLAYFITYITASGLITTTYLKYPKKHILYGSYSTLFIALYYLFIYLNLTPITALSIISGIVVVINLLIPKKTTLYSFNKILSLVLFGFIINNLKSASELSLLIASIINIINLNSIIITDKEEQPILYIILTYLLIYLAIVPLSILEGYTPLIVSLITALYTLLISTSIIPTKELDKTFNSILFSTTTIITFTVSCFKYPIIAPFIIIIYMFVNEVLKYGLFNSKKEELSRYFEPFSLCALIISFQVNLTFKVEISLSLAIASFIFCILNVLYTGKKDRLIYFIFSMIAIFISIITNIYNQNIISALMAIISALIVFAKTYEYEDDNALLVIVYVLLLSTIYMPFVMTNILNINILLTTLVFLLIIVLTNIILRNDLLNKIGLFYIVLPMISLITNNSIPYEMNQVMKSALYLYIIYVLLRFILKDSIVRNIVGIIGVIIAMYDVFFIVSPTTGIYIGLVGLAVILIGLKYEELSPLFKFGIVLTILNIIYQLKGLWEMIPFWLYLLVGGLLIIGIVTYKELQRQKNNNDKKA